MSAEDRDPLPEAALAAMPGAGRRGSLPARPRRLRGRFDSLASLYANPRRLRSREHDLGLCWRADDGRTYRAAVIVDTGELYTFEHGGSGTVVVLGRIPPEAVDVALAGWRDVCGEPGSYEWLRARVERFVNARREARR